MRNWFHFSDKSYWILVFPIVWSSVPYVTYRFKTFVAFAVICLWVLIHLGRGLRRSLANDSLSRAFSPALFFFLLHLFLRDVYFLFGHGMHSEYYELATNLMMAVWLLVLHRSIVECRFKELIFLAGLSMICCIISGLFAIRGMNAGFTDAARKMMPGSDNIDLLYQIVDSRDMGMGGFSMMYGCAMYATLYAKAFFTTRVKKLKVYFAICILSCLITIKSGGLGTPVVVSFFGILLALISHMTGRRRKILGVVTFLFMLGFITFAFCPSIYSPFSSLFTFIGENMSEGSIRDRVLSAAQAFAGDHDQYALERARFQMRSLFGFFKSPFFGNGFIRMSEDVSGHSLILDQLAYGGIVAILPFLLFIIFMLKYFRLVGKYYYGASWMVMPTIYISVALLAGLMNPVFLFSANFFILLPALGAVLYEKQWRQSVHPRVDVSYVRGW